MSKMLVSRVMIHVRMAAAMIVGVFGGVGHVLSFMRAAAEKSIVSLLLALSKLKMQISSLRSEEQRVTGVLF